jgi:2-dehydro-3-deoxyphosphogluconate aldolase/(4S)-4-hydroxy-2-oxoglutarate aldolase
LTEDQAERAVAAGARFIVAPGFNPKVVDWCVEKGVPVTPGVNSPTQIEMAMERDLSVLKFFPAEASGGLAMLKAMSGPYGGIKFIPTGGINAGNLATYLASPLIHACGGSWLAKTDVIASGNFEEVTRVTREAVSLVLGFEMAHVGINEDSDKKAESSAQFFTDVFQFPLKVGSSSVFSGSGIEVTKKPVQGTHGHIAISTNNIERAVAYLQRKGIETDPESAKTKNGKMIAIYLGGEISGFAVHLLQK